MNKYRIANPNNKVVRDCKSRTTEKIIIVCILTLITLRIYGLKSDVPLNSLV